MNNQGLDILFSITSERSSSLPKNNFIGTAFEKIKTTLKKSKEKNFEFPSKISSVVEIFDFRVG
jgi:hypothetical protein